MFIKQGTLFYDKDSGRYNFYYIDEDGHGLQLKTKRDRMGPARNNPHMGHCRLDILLWLCADRSGAETSGLSRKTHQ